LFGGGIGSTGFNGVIPIYIGLGGNFPTTRDAMITAIKAICQHITLSQVSPLYTTPPMYYTEQPPFLNAVIEGQGDISPLALLSILQAIENEAGRERPFHNAPRILDLDILWMGDLCYTDVRLSIPHPRRLERPFVLKPMLDIASHFTDPLTQHTTATLYSRLTAHEPLTLADDQGAWQNACLMDVDWLEITAYGEL
jgi:2-amino-4-hydroxy-6-hydroxymethyldihydropteridine diphosphokinase